MQIARIRVPIVIETFLETLSAITPVGISKTLVLKAATLIKNRVVTESKPLVSVRKKYNIGTQNPVFDKKVKI